MRAGDFLRLDKGLRALLAPVLAVVLAAAWAGPSARAQGNAIEARYELVSTAEFEDGTTVATFLITFTNDSDTDFADATVRLFGDGAMLEDQATVAVGPFWAGDSVSRNVELRLLGPLWAGDSVSRNVELRLLGPLMDDGGLMLYGEAAEADGEGESIPVTISKGMQTRGGGKVHPGPDTAFQRGASGER